MCVASLALTEQVEALQQQLGGLEAQYQHLSAQNQELALEHHDVAQQLELLDNWLEQYRLLIQVHKAIVMVE